jgi:Tfp pilus assembly protein PilF
LRSGIPAVWGVAGTHWGAMMWVVGEAVDFFVSYTTADRPWAEWIAWELEDAGYSVIVQAWDFGAGSNFVSAMHDAARRARRTVAVLSPAFLESPYCEAEWGAAFREDPTGRERKLVPVRVRACEPKGLLGQIVYVDVAGLSDADARAALLKGVNDSRAKPVAAPRFPGADRAGEGGRALFPEAGAAIFNVPVTTRVFVGRAQQLQQLEEGLLADGAVAITQVQAIHGMGGVGKTQLAAHYAREHRGEYDVVWWLRAEEPETLGADLAALATKLGLVDAQSDQQKAIEAAREWLEQHGRWLLVFDNAPGSDAIAGLLPEGDGGGHVLVTSRAHADWRALHALPLALDVWPRAESVEFMRERADEKDDGAADAVAQALGDLPLALEQAAAYANFKAITLAGYAERLRERAPELFGWHRQGYVHTVLTVWQLAFEQIAEHPVASDLLVVCALLAPERIPRELLEAAVEHGRPPDAGTQAADEAIELLLSYALLTAAGEQTFDMHRLIGQLTRARANPAAQANATATAMTAFEALWPEWPWEPQLWPACERLLAHALAATQHSQQHDVALKHTATVLGRVGQYQHARAQLISAWQLTQRALTMKEAIYGPEHPEVARALGGLGNVQRELGELESARVTLQRALAIDEAVFGPEDPHVAGTLTNLGIVQLLLGELEAARLTLKRALTIHEAVHGPEHADVACTLGNLGIVQRQLGRFEEARSSQQRVLAIEEAVHGPEHPEVARTLNNLGLVQVKLGELGPARLTLQRALAINEAVHGPEHPEVARTLNNLGIMQQQRGELEPARASQLRALAIREAVYGLEHPEVAITLGDLGIAQLELGEVESARLTLQRALGIFENFLGPNHPHTAQTRAILQSISPGPGDGTK